MNFLLFSCIYTMSIFHVKINDPGSNMTNCAICRYVEIYSPLMYLFEEKKSLDIEF